MANFSFTAGTTGTPAGVVLQAGGGQTDFAGNGAAVTLTSRGQISTAGNLAAAVTAQSIGGGGGAASFSAATPIPIGLGGLSALLGNTAGLGGSAGAVDVEVLSGGVVTTGAGAPAIIAQSIAGGGGFTGYFNGSDTIASAMLGASSGSGSADNVTVNNAVQVTTSGTGSVGLLAQSIGGGGGAAILSGVSSFTNVTLGKSGGSAADAGNVQVTNSGAVTTQGAFAHGIVAQSIGGGGGLVIGATSSNTMSGYNVTAAANNPGGNGGTVQVTSTADITTSGLGAHAIIAQSIGGGGGLVGGGALTTSLPATSAFAGSAGASGSGGAVTINLQSNVSASGQDAIGVFAQSTGASGGGNIALTVAANKTLSGTGFAARFDGGNNNSLQNYGTITGSLDLGSRNNAVTNALNATLNLGSVANLGTGTLTNDGIITLGGANAMTATNLTGNLVQTSAGLYVVKVQSTNSDQMNVSGTATLDGNVLAKFGNGSSWKNSYTIVHANGGVNGSFNALGTLNLPASLTASLKQTANDVYLKLESALGSNGSGTPGGTVTNRQNLTDAINSAFNGGSTLPSGFGTLLNLSGPALSNALTQLTGEVGSNGGQQGALNLTNSFTSLLLNGFVSSRPAIGGGIGAAGLAYAEEPRVRREASEAFASLAPYLNPNLPASFERRWNIWSSVYGGQAIASGDSSVGSNDTKTRSYGLATGLDYRLSPTTMIGFALAAGQTGWSVSNGLGGGKSDVFQFGTYGSYRFAQSYVAASASYSWHGMTTNRNVAVVTADQLTAKFGAHNIGARIEAGHRLDIPLSLGLTPYVAGQSQAFFMPAYGETATSGSNQFALTYASRTATMLRAEVGSWIDSKRLFGTVPVNLFGKAAYAHDWNSSGATSAYFQAVPAASFVVMGAATPKNLALLSAGAEVSINDGTAVTVKFDGEYAHALQSYAGTVTLRHAW